MFSCMPFSAASGGADPLQELRDLCVFAFNGDTSGFSGNDYAPEVGTGLLQRQTASQVTGKINQAVNISGSSNKVLVANAQLNAYSPLFFKDANGADTDYTVSFWCSFDSFIQDSYLFHNRKVTPRGGYLFLWNRSSQKFVAVQQGLVNGVIKSINYNFDNPSLNTNTYHLFVFKYEAGTKTFTLKINNSAVNHTSIEDSGFVNKEMSESEIVLGAANGINIPLRGSLDTTQVFNGMTTNDQDALLWNSGNGIQLF